MNLILFQKQSETHLTIEGYAPLTEKQWEAWNVRTVETEKQQNYRTN